MKKVVTMLLIGLMVLANFTAVFAEEPGDALTQESLEHELTVKDEKVSLSALKDFAEEIHQVNNLRIARNQLQASIIEKQDALIDLYLEAKEAGNKEGLKAAKEERKQIKGIHEEIKALHEQAKAAKAAFREAKKSNDIEAANAELEKLVNVHGSINSKLQKKLDILNKVVEILS